MLALHPGGALGTKGAVWESQEKKMYFFPMDLGMVAALGLTLWEHHRMQHWLSADMMGFAVHLQDELFSCIPSLILEPDLLDGAVWWQRRCKASPSCCPILTQWLCCAVYTKGCEHPASFGAGRGGA